MATFTGDKQPGKCFSSDMVEAVFSQPILISRIQFRLQSWSWGCHYFQQMFKQANIDILFHIHSKQCNMPTISLRIIWWTAGILVRAGWCVCVCVCVCARVRVCVHNCASVCMLWARVDTGRNGTMGRKESNEIIFFFVYCCFSLQHIYIIFLMYTHC